MFKIGNLYKTLTITGHITVTPDAANCIAFIYGSASLDSQGNNGLVRDLLIVTRLDGGKNVDDAFAGAAVSIELR